VAGNRHSTICSTFYPLRANVGAHSARSIELGERRGAHSPSVPAASGASLASESLCCSSAPSIFSLGQGNAWLRGWRLCASHQGRSRGMPCHLLSTLPRQSDRAGNPPPLVGQGGWAGRTVSSPRHGQGAEEMESSNMPRSKSRKLTNTNITPLPSTPDVVGASTDTRGFTP
jgi:hypothetical protein